MIASSVHHRKRQRGIKFLALLCLFMIISLSVLNYRAGDWNAQTDQHLLSPSRLTGENRVLRLSDTKAKEGTHTAVTNNGTHLIRKPGDGLAEKQKEGEWVESAETQEQRAIRDGHRTSSIQNALPETETTFIESSSDLKDQHTILPQVKQVPLQQFVFDLVVSLLARPSRHGNNDASINPCSGFLLRDDMVLTSKECAKMANSVDVPGYGNRFIRSKFQSVTDNLALVGLELPPYNRLEGPEYSANSGWPRLRMFLGSAGNDTDNGFAFDSHHDGLTFRVSADENERRPILSVFAGDEDDLITTQLFQNNSDDAFKLELGKMLFDEQNWTETMALMSNDETGERWWVRKQTPADINQQIQKWLMQHSEAPPGALSIGGGLGLSAILKIEDPLGGRRHFCLKRYFFHWASEETFSEEPFFQWLDYGSGKYFDDPKCPREKLNELHMYFMNEEDRKKVAVNLMVVDGGKTVRLVFVESRMPVPEGGWLFVQGIDKMLYLAHEERDVVGHASIFTGGPILHAGEMQICGDGRLVRMSSKSGHYRPTSNHSTAFIEFLKERGTDKRALVWTRNTTRSFIEWKQVFGEAILVPDGKATGLCQSQFLREYIGQKSA